ncbi:hypothetical protein OsJ_32661 [Oryza sativa Japonica Group]|uniref:Uncharacterized protein n=2 Tax=Oryza sativa TaxID=4530 RepID=A3C7U2_ORYSJ|nr:hypothetical protein OsJ_32661 [Oryza sativa Japonica Group]
MASRMAVAVAPETSHHGSRTEAATAALEPSRRRWRRVRRRRLPSPPMWMTPEPSRVDGVEDGGSDSSIDLSLQLALRTVAVAPEPSGGSRGRASLTPPPPRRRRQICSGQRPAGEQLHDILALVGTRQAMRTSILSRAGARVWRWWAAIASRISPTVPPRLAGLLPTSRPASAELACANLVDQGDFDGARRVVDAVLSAAGPRGEVSMHTILITSTKLGLAKLGCLSVHTATRGFRIHGNVPASTW